MAQITIEVPDEAAEALSNDNRRRAVSAIVTLMLRPRGDGEASPFIAQLDEIQREARGSGLTDADIEAKLAAYNAERRT
jgi:hypothetical protein